MLAERLTERILESRDDILADSMGMSYLSEIEAVYEQVGARLSHVNSMLNNLPPLKETAEQQAEEPPADTALSNLSLPAPRPIAALMPPVEAPSFHLFAMQVTAGNLSQAGTTLAALFQLEPDRAEKCLLLFHQKLQADSQFIVKVMQLRRELTAGNTNAALMLLWKCFGLHGLESIGVLQTLQQRLAVSDATN